ncbi:VCBS repeat-containing protein [Streptomyces lateritius]|uniref:FG-GAP repeat domain-containing protein n=1 Tax=Streptomyces lateritius TaxID=67313 RepID=UPI001C8B6416|nr:VCBS repeat-containing protein [Streptomyces lateritius]MBX9424770.1 VCBS repeat-containing protein [Streptomyces lateritius]
MNHARTSGRRLAAAAAVTVVLAATGGTITALPATAAAPAATQQEQQTATVPFPRDADVVGAGPSGFLSKTRGSKPEVRWTWYADGSSAVLPGAVAADASSDLVVTGDRTYLSESRVVQLHDMSTPASAAAAPIVVDLDRLGPGYSFAGVFGSRLAVLVPTDEDSHRTGLLAFENGKLTERPITGLPEDCYPSIHGGHTADAAVFDCWDRDDIPFTKAVVDLTTATTVFSQAQDAGGPAQWQNAISDTHAVWREHDGTTDWFGVHRRGTSERKLIKASGSSYDALHLVGGWIAQGRQVHIEATVNPNGWSELQSRPFTAESVETGEKAQLLTAHSSAVPGPGGSLLVRGGTPEQGEGLYRISPRDDGGRPDVELVASTRQSTVVTLLGSAAPKTLTGDQVARGVPLSWDLSRADSNVTLTLTHVRSGASFDFRWHNPYGLTAGTPRRFAWRWDGRDLERPYGLSGPARAGEYEWQIVAVPDEGIGPRLVTTGRFTVTRPAAPHDFDGDGSADLFTRVPGGDLWSYRSQPVAVGGSIRHAGQTRIGAGWQVYDRLETAGNIAGTSAPDVLARDRSGALWLHRGTGDRGTPFSGRTLVSAGWQVYDRIAAGGDVTGEGRPDLVATDKAGVLWLHPGTGNATTPFAARKRLGGGWGVYNEVVAVGNIAGGPAGDLLARDRAGVLWSHLGKGDGTFAPRTRVGGGWGGFTDLVGVGDANGDGRADLIASAGGATFYAGTGDWKAPLKAGLRTDVTNGVPYDAAF